MPGYEDDLCFSNLEQRIREDTSFTFISMDTAIEFEDHVQLFSNRKRGTMRNVVIHHSMIKASDFVWFISFTTYFGNLQMYDIVHRIVYILYIYIKVLLIISSLIFVSLSYLYQHVIDKQLSASSFKFKSNLQKNTLNELSERKLCELSKRTFQEIIWITL